MGCFGERVQRGDARSVLRKADDHRRSTRGCKRRDPRAPATIHGAVGTLSQRGADGVANREAGRGERIRTSGLYVPNVALYQAKLHPDFVPTADAALRQERVECQDDARRIEPTILAERRGTAMPGSRSSDARALSASARAARASRPARRSRARSRRCRPGARPRRARSRGGRARARPACRAPSRSDQRQRGLAFAQVVADVLAELLGRALVVEQVVDRAGTPCRASGRSPRTPPRSSASASASTAPSARARLEQLGGLEADHAQVVVDRRCRGRACSSAAALRLRR